MICPTPEAPKRWRAQLDRGAQVRSVERDAQKAAGFDKRGRGISSVPIGLRLLMTFDPWQSMAPVGLDLLTIGND
jgi:hypothetical protein